MTSVPVQAILAGKSVPFARGEMSAIAKVPVSGRVEIGLTGVAGDEQADPRYHGGPDKALHQYPFDHYAYWAALKPEHALLDKPGAFGENLSVSGLTEADVCIGDRFRIGTALIEVSQGREPCWKQATRMDWPMLPKLIVRERRCGWYFRVIEPGTATAGDEMTLIDRVLPEWTVRRMFGLLFGGDHKRDPAALKVVRDMGLLFTGWRERASALIID